MARAQGARAQMALAFETTYGTPPAGGFTKMPFASTTLGAEQPLLNSELLGYGRDPLAPIKDAVTADGDVVVPLDAEAFGFWLKAALGEPITSGTGPWTHEFRSGSWVLPSISIETAMPEVAVPEEKASLASGFLQSGVAGVLGSLWAVSDRSTALVVLRFHELRQSLDPCEALRRAQIWLRDSTASELRAWLQDRGSEVAMLLDGLPSEGRPFSLPFHWAGYAYSGV